MPHYKDLQNKLHCLDDAQYEYLLPVGSVQITDEEANAIRAVNIDPKDEIRKRIEILKDEIFNTTIGAGAMAGQPEDIVLVQAKFAEIQSLKSQL